MIESIKRFCFWAVLSFLVGGATTQCLCATPTRAGGSYVTRPKNVLGMNYLFEVRSNISHFMKVALDGKSFNKALQYKTDTKFIEALEDGLLADNQAIKAINENAELVDEYYAFYTQTKGTLAEFLSNSYKLVSKLRGNLRSAFEEIVSQGARYTDDGKEIRLFDLNGHEFGTITSNKLNPKRWISTRNIDESNITKTAEGYYLVRVNENEFAFNIGYKDSRVLSAEEVNAYYKTIGKNEPYKRGTHVIERSLQPGDKVYVVENFGSGIPNPGAWGSKNKITSEKELREYLAVLEAWKKSNGITDPLVVREYTVKSLMPVRDGVIGPQMDVFSDGSYRIYYGGEHQYEFINDLRGNKWETFFTISDKSGFVLK